MGKENVKNWLDGKWGLNALLIISMIGVVVGVGSTILGLGDYFDTHNLIVEFDNQSSTIWTITFVAKADGSVVASVESQANERSVTFLPRVITLDGSTLRFPDDVKMICDSEVSEELYEIDGQDLAKRLNGRRLEIDDDGPSVRAPD